MGANDMADMGTKEAGYNVEEIKLGLGWLETALGGTIICLFASKYFENNSKAE